MKKGMNAWGMDASNVRLGREGEKKLCVRTIIR